MESKAYPLISVIVPVYNIEKYVSRCIESIVNQTYRNLEIILVDDGSTDSSGVICDEWGKKDSRIRIIHKENGKLVSARKAGIAIAKGEYAGYVDGDDWIEPDMYEQIYLNGIIYDADMVAYELLRDYANGTSWRRTLFLSAYAYQGREQMKDLLLHVVDTEHFMDGMPMNVCYLFRTELLKKNQLEVDNRILCAEDVAVVFPCLMEAESVVLLHKPLYHYRQNEGSIKYKNKERDTSGLLCLYQRLMESYNKCFCKSELLKKEILFTVFYTILWSYYELCLTPKSTDLFPYDIPLGSRIALYGAGPFGMKVYNRVKQVGICEIAFWVDRRWSMYRDRGLPVQNIDMLKLGGYDYVVIAVLNASLQNEIRKELVQMGIEDKIIKCCNPDYFTEEQLKILLK